MKGPQGIKNILGTDNPSVDILLIGKIYCAMDIQTDKYGRDRSPKALAGPEGSSPHLQELEGSPVLLVPFIFVIWKY